MALLAARPGLGCMRIRRMSNAPPASKRERGRERFMASVRDWRGGRGAGICILVAGDNQRSLCAISARLWLHLGVIYAFARWHNCGMLQGVSGSGAEGGGGSWSSRLSCKLIENLQRPRHKIMSTALSDMQGSWQRLLGLWARIFMKNNYTFVVCQSNRKRGQKSKPQVRRRVEKSPDKLPQRELSQYNTHTHTDTHSYTGTHQNGGQLRTGRKSHLSLYWHVAGLSCQLVRLGSTLGPVASVPRHESLLVLALRKYWYNVVCVCAVCVCVHKQLRPA